MPLIAVAPSRPTAPQGVQVVAAPPHWETPCTHTECTLHQLSPYIGKLKSRIAADLVRRYSRRGDLVADVFCGSGTIPLEALRLGRRVFAADTNPYAMLLTRAKVNAPVSLEAAQSHAAVLLDNAEHQPAPDLRRVPTWVRRFFHPRTLKEVLRFAKTLQPVGDSFAFACLLGILHHQRRGFLSHPSSHLIPYLRDKKYPPHAFPELWSYRPLRPRLLAKIGRTLRRPLPIPQIQRHARLESASIEQIELPDRLDCLITSPPYMNALDYGRDNRLRLWLAGTDRPEELDRFTGGFEAFRSAIQILATKLEQRLKPSGHAIFVIGDRQTRRSATGYPSEELMRIVRQRSPSLKLQSIVCDEIPDIRRARRHGRGVKREHIVVYRKVTNA
ncbi:MAG: DNA methyltransferase [Acidobacteria bacterium]|nr:DNA methyltransferase [Acidobacteriota bacterium]